MAQLKTSHSPVRLQPFTNKPIAVLDEAGHWNAKFAPGLDDKALLETYENLVRARLLDERLHKLLRTGKTSFVAPSDGHEGAQIGVTRAMRRGHDWAFPYYRDTGVFASLTSLDEIFAQFLGRRSDRNKGRQMPTHIGSDRDHIFTACSSIASQVPPAVGMAMAAQQQGKDEVMVVTFGDGATSEGDWHTAMNLAAVSDAPIVFACENNGYAISVGGEKQTRARCIADKAHAYGMPGYQVDGMDTMAVYHVMRQAIEDARAGHGPALVEMCVYRYGPHSSSDDDSVYRSREEVAKWKQRDPLPRFRKFLETRKLWDEARDEVLYKQTRDTLAQAAEKAEADAVPPADWLFDDVYADLPWHLQQQRELMRAELAAGA